VLYPGIGWKRLTWSFCEGILRNEKTLAFAVRTTQNDGVSSFPRLIDKAMPDPHGTIPDAKVRRQPAGVQIGAHPNARHRSAQQKDELSEPSFASVAWPVAVGLVLAFFAPQLRDMLGPWNP
jgi:hypothetical protein